MSSGPSYSAPATVTPVSPAPTVQSYTDSDEVNNAKKNERRKAAQAAGYQSTIATSGSGLLNAAPTQQKTLLGS